MTTVQAGCIGAHLEVEHPARRIVLAFAFFHFHRLCSVLTNRWLLAQSIPWMNGRLLAASLMTALLAWPLFALLDKLRQDED